jgi:hypothetical protein
VCQGSADALLLPVLLAVAAKIGFAAEAAVLGPAYQAHIRDKNAAFDALEKASVKYSSGSVGSCIHVCSQPARAAS